MRKTILFFALALIGILGAMVVKQRSTINSLQRELTEVASGVKPQANESVPADVPLINESASPASESSPELANTSSPTSALTLSATTNRADADIRTTLEMQVQQLQAALEQTKRLVPGPEDANAAYVGPGTWVNADLQTGGTMKIVIAGKAESPGQISAMTIRMWGRSHPTDYESPEVPFYLLDRFDRSYVYRRGFAIWEYARGSRTYLLITFEKSGLRIDKVRFRSGESVTPYSVVERMTRIQ